MRILVLSLILCGLSFNANSGPLEELAMNVYANCSNHCAAKLQSCNRAVKSLVRVKGAQCISTFPISDCNEQYQRNLDICDNRGALCKVKCQFLYRN